MFIVISYTLCLAFRKVPAPGGIRILGGERSVLRYGAAHILFLIDPDLVVKVTHMRVTIFRAAPRIRELGSKDAGNLWRLS
mgnify:CR=1 FL=1